MEINRRVTAVKSPAMVKQIDGEISEAQISELSRTLKQRENSLQYPFFQHGSRSRLEIGDCPQAGCQQGGSEEFEHGGKGYSLISLLRGEEEGLVDAVNPFSELREVWDRYIFLFFLCNHCHHHCSDR